MNKRIDSYIGRRLKTFRQLRGWTQKDLAARLGITFQQVQKYEKGMNSISSGRLYQLSRLLCVLPHEFFPAEGEDLETGSAHNLTLQLVRYFSLISCARHRDALVQLSKALTDEGAIQQQEKLMGR